MARPTEAVLLDTSALMALLLEEPDWREVQAVITSRKGYLASTIEIEVGNALSRQFRRGLLNAAEVGAVWDIFTAVRELFEIVPVDVRSALDVVTARRMWAYDAYVVEAAMRAGVPLLTRDNQQAAIAALQGVKIL